MKRLGEKRTQAGPDGRIPIRALKVTFGSDSRPVVANAKKLKGMPAPYDKIYIKKDMHPAVRREFTRLREAEKKLREDPDTQGRDIEYDRDSRTLKVDGVIVDRFRSSFFY